MRAKYKKDQAKASSPTKNHYLRVYKSLLTEQYTYYINYYYIIALKKHLS